MTSQNTLVILSWICSKSDFLLCCINGIRKGQILVYGIVRPGGRQKSGKIYWAGIFQNYNCLFPDFLDAGDKQIQKWNWGAYFPLKVLGKLNGKYE